MAYNEQSTERQRFRSFCERYLIARAPFFEKGREEEDAYHCMLGAKAIYNRLNAFSVSFEDRDEPQEDATPAAQAHAAQALKNRFKVQQAVQSGVISPGSGAAILNALNKGKGP